MMSICTDFALLFKRALLHWICSCLFSILGHQCKIERWSFWQGKSEMTKGMLGTWQNFPCHCIWNIWFPLQNLSPSLGFFTLVHLTPPYSILFCVWFPVQWDQVPHRVLHFQLSSYMTTLKDLGRKPEGLPFTVAALTPYCICLSSLYEQRG